MQKHVFKKIQELERSTDVQVLGKQGSALIFLFDTLNYLAS